MDKQIDRAAPTASNNVNDLPILTISLQLLAICKIGNCPRPPLKDRIVKVALQDGAGAAKVETLQGLMVVANMAVSGAPQ